MSRKPIMFVVSLSVAGALLLSGVLVFVFRGAGNPLGVALCLGAGVIGIAYTAIRNSQNSTPPR